MTATTPETTVETLPYKNPDLPASERIADLPQHGAVSSFCFRLCFYFLVPRLSCG